MRKMKPRVENAFADVDLDQFFIGVSPLEIRPDAGVVHVDLGVPLIDRVVGIRDRFAVGLPRIIVPGRPLFGFSDILKRGGFEEGFAVQIDFAQVNGRVHGRYHPVAVKPCVERVEIAEQRIGDHGLPHRAVSLAGPDRKSVV